MGRQSRQKIVGCPRIRISVPCLKNIQVKNQKTTVLRKSTKDAHTEVFHIFGYTPS